MPSLTMPRRQMKSGESQVSQEFVVPDPPPTSASIQLDMSPQEIRDPSTHVKGIFEFWDDVELMDWRLVAATIVQGDPNAPNQTQVVNISPHALEIIKGKRAHGRILALSDGNYGGTLNWVDFVPPVG